MNRTFTTKRLPLANYLIASKRLKFLRLEEDERYPNRFRFIFDDEYGEGLTAESEFNGGALVAALDFVAAQTFLRRQMTEQKSGQVTSKFEENHESRHTSR